MTNYAQEKNEYAEYGKRLKKCIGEIESSEMLSRVEEFKRVGKKPFPLQLKHQSLESYAEDLNQWQKN